VQSEQKLAGVPIVAVPVVLVTPENVKATLIDSGFHTADAVKSCP